MVNFWRLAEKFGRRFIVSFPLYFSNFRCISRIFDENLNGRQIQSFQAKKKSFWSWALYLCMFDCVKGNCDQTLKSGFSLCGGIPPPLDHPEILDAGSNRFKSQSIMSERCWPSGKSIWWDMLPKAWTVATLQSRWVPGLGQAEQNVSHFRPVVLFSPHPQKSPQRPSQCHVWQHHQLGQ